LLQLRREVAARREGTAEEEASDPLDVDAHFLSLMLVPHMLSRPALYEVREPMIC
jgi:hypothetical protein